jgi:hypothetical protein
MQKINYKDLPINLPEAYRERIDALPIDEIIRILSRRLAARLKLLGVELKVHDLIVKLADKYDEEYNALEELHNVHASLEHFRLARLCSSAAYYLDGDMYRSIYEYYFSFETTELALADLNIA